MELRSGAMRTRQTKSEKETVTKRIASPKKTAKTTKKEISVVKSPEKKSPPKTAVVEARRSRRHGQKQTAPKQEKRSVSTRARNRKTEVEIVESTVKEIEATKTVIKSPDKKKESAPKQEKRSVSTRGRNRKSESEVVEPTVKETETTKTRGRRKILTEEPEKPIKEKTSDKPETVKTTKRAAKTEPEPEIKRGRRKSARNTDESQSQQSEGVASKKRKVEFASVTVEKNEVEEKQKRGTRKSKSEVSVAEIEEQGIPKRATRNSRSLGSVASSNVPETEVEVKKRGRKPVQKEENKTATPSRTSRRKATTESDQRIINASGVQIIFNDEKPTIEETVPIPSKSKARGRPKKVKPVESTPDTELPEASDINSTDIGDVSDATQHAVTESTSADNIEAVGTDVDSIETTQREESLVDVPPSVLDVVTTLTTQVASMIDIESPSSKKLPLKKPRSGIRVKDLEIPKIPPITGYLATFGDDNCGELGHSSIGITKTKPTLISDLAESVVCTAAGAMHTVCVTASGQVLTFGCNDECALGRISSEDNEARPTKVPLPVQVTKVTAGDSHTAALTALGCVYYWGNFRDQNGRIGLTKESTDSILEPTPVKFETTFVDIASGCNHLLLLSDSGEVYTVGVGEQGALGRLPDTECKFEKDVASRFLTPGKIIVSKSEVFDKVWAGNYTSFARTVTGKVYAWGLNNFCQLGFRSSNPEETSAVEYFPQLLPTFTRSQAKVVQICGGSHHSLALDADGRVYSCGRFEYGRLGHGESGSDEESFKPIESLMKQKVVEICCGPVCSFAVTENGQLYSWGMASSNLGVGGDEVDLHSPTQVRAKSLIDRCVLSVTAGSQHSAIIVSTGDGNHNGN
ncbi:Regulator of chromosome condensation-like protein [Leptotrombidium deliense]|uniref:Regulator of chromosome condensation-like protein n=1 Tax=Leptotrombidium deliense TaxID=299467 RepID=A0A443SLH8_9ACAR|nr:Regulator of chromosome condensation-like protein [Leptotrombidium deliense]